MPLTAAELTVEVQETNRRLTEAIHSLNVEVARINTSLNWAKGIGASLLGCALGILAFAYRVDQKATRGELAVAGLATSVAGLASDVAAFKAETRASFAELNARDRQVLEALARLEKAAPSPR